LTSLVDDYRAIPSEEFSGYDRSAIPIAMNKSRKRKISVSLNLILFVVGVISWLAPSGVAQTSAVDYVSQNAPRPKNIVAATIPVGESPLWVVTSPDSKTVYVSNYFSNTVSVIDAATNTVTFTIPVPSNPQSLAITPDGQKLYVVCLGLPAVAVIDTTSDAVTAVVSSGETPGNIAVSPDGKSAILPSGGQVLVFHTDTNQVSYVELESPLDAYGAIFSPNGYAYVLTAINNDSQSGLLRIDLSSLVQRRLAWGTLPDATGMTFSPDGKTLYVGTIVELSGEPMTKIAVYDVRQHRIRSRILLPGKNTFGGVQGAVTPDGKYLYFPHGDLYMIDTASDRLVGSPVTVGYGLYAVAIAPDGKTAYAVNTDGSPTSGSRPGHTSYGTVSVIDISSQSP
jgi:YVTN family beta-propeller protein